MKTFFVIVLAGMFASASLVWSQGRDAAPCQGCAQKAAPAVAAPVQSVPPELANLPKGRIENVMPVGMLIVLGCESCAAEAVQWALAQGSTTEDINLALNTVAAVQKLECFNQKFGADVSGRMEKPLAAARKALDEAVTRR